MAEKVYHKPLTAMFNAPPAGASVNAADLGDE
jgi:hypothetical protein